MAANRKGIGLTTLKRACNEHTHQVFISSYAQNTLQRLAHLRPEGERDGPNCPIVLKNSSSSSYYSYFAVTHKLHKLHS